jgi:hypothetical protein
MSTEQLKVDDVVHGASRNSRQLIHHETVIDNAKQPHVSAKKVLEYPSSIAQLFVSEIVARMMFPYRQRVGRGILLRRVGDPKRHEDRMVWQRRGE